MNIYEKIQQVKLKLLEANIKKSGRNKFAGYEYYELADFTPYIIKFCNDTKLFTSISFNNEIATLTIINAEKPDEKVEYTSPMTDLELKGCNKVQALGGTETYSRRYLYMTAFDIIENDMFDATISENETIDSIKVNTLLQVIKDGNISNERVLNVLNSKGYKKLMDIKETDFKTVYNELKGA